MPRHVDDLLREGRRALIDGEPDVAARILRRAVAVDPDDPDVRHALGCAYEELGREDAMKREFLQVRLLDAELDRHAGVGTARDDRFIENVANEVLASLPEPFRSDVAHVPVMLMKRPSLMMVRSGLDPRVLGIFEGPTVLDTEADGVELPAHIIVFTMNLLADTGSREELAEQIEITLLHEIGHYFGLSEEALVDVGLG